MFKGNPSKKVYVVGSTGVTDEMDLYNIKYLPIGPDNPDENEIPHVRTSITGI